MRMLCLVSIIDLDKLRKILLLQAAVVLLFLVSVPISSQAQSEENILFVGNSYTYFWNLPQQVSVIAESKGMSLKTSQSTSGGTNWGQHWRGEKNISSKSLIENGQFDAIILQNHSMRSLEAPDSLMYYGKLFADLIQKNDAKVFLYMTWAREWDPYMQATIRTAYEQLARETGATVVPVGLAWERARNLRPDIELFAKDGSHPSPLGSYLTACVFYRVLTGKEIDNLPPRLLTKDSNGEKLYLNIVTEEDAVFLQKVAEETVSSYRSSTVSN